MTPPTHAHPIDRRPADLGRLSWACVLASAVFPPLILAAVAVAHCAWRSWLSGRPQRGFRWALSAMIGAHVALTAWWVLLGAWVAGPWGAAVSFAYLLVFFIVIAFILQSAAAKYFVVGTLLASVGLGMLLCWSHNQRELTRRNACLHHLRRQGVELFGDEHRRIRADVRIAAENVPVGTLEDNDSLLVQSLPHIEERSALIDKPVAGARDEDGWAQTQSSKKGE